MGKKIVLYVVVLAAVFFIGFVACFSYLKLDINQSAKEVEYEHTYTSFSVVQMSFENNLSFDGTILISDDKSYVDVYELYYSSYRQAEVLVSQGDEVTAETVLGSGLVSGAFKNVTCKSNGQVVYISDDTEEKCVYLEVLNRDALYFTVYFPYKQLDLLSDEMTIYFYNSDGEKINCRLDYVGYEIGEDNTVEIHLVPEDATGLLPGVSKTLYFVLDEMEECLAIPQSAVMVESDSYFVQIYDGEDYVTKQVVLGDLFSIQEDDNTWWYYRVKSGLSEGDTVYMEIIKTNETEKIDEFLEKD